MNKPTSTSTFYDNIIGSTDKINKFVDLIENITMKDYFNPQNRSNIRLLIDLLRSYVVDEALFNKDVDLILSQTMASREQATKALLKHNNDIVNAIMELTF